VAKRFDELDPEPIATRAAAQTHRGVADGAPVAIRIRRPGVDRMVRGDLALLDALALPLATALPQVDAGALLRSVREQVLDDLDFEHEASVHRRAARLLRAVDGLVVPAVHADRCTEDVFVTDLLPAGAGSHSDVARVLVDAHRTAAAAGLLLLDPRPGHVLALPDGRLGLLGVGQARPVDAARATAAFDGEITLDAAVRILRTPPDDIWIARSVGQLAATIEASSAGARR
jgi:ubiquinone biosynthesis protein